MVLTEAQLKVWKFVSDSQRTRPEGSPPPSFDEIAEATGMSKSWAASAIAVLEALGKLRRDRRARSLWVVELHPEKSEKKRKSA